jgi:hypothetical protein
MGNYKLINLYTYSLDRLNAAKIIYVVVNHQFALIKRGKWKCMESSNSLGLQLVAILLDQLGGEHELKRNSGTEFAIRFRVLEKN